jgi:hypothetical protein
MLIMSLYYFFITDLDSLGIQSIYHHLYEFGTTSIFVAFEAKFTERFINKDNSIIQRRFVNIKIVTDERRVDGFYYASALRYLRDCFNTLSDWKKDLRQLLMTCCKNAIQNGYNFT